MFWFFEETDDTEYVYNNLVDESANTITDESGNQIVMKKEA